MKHFHRLLLCLDDEESVDSLCLVARQLDTRPDTSVIGLHTLPGTQIFPLTNPHLPISLYADINRKHRELSARVAARFGEFAQNHSSWQWREAEGHYPFDYRHYVNLAQTSDLVIAAQPTPYIDGVDLQRELVAQSGGAVLMVPISQPGRNYAFNRVAIMWNSTASTARALKASLPLLSAAREVHVVKVAQAGSRYSSTKAPLDDLLDYLSAYDVFPEIHKFDNNPATQGNELLSFTRANNINLMIMSAFDHSAFYEFIIGVAMRETINSLGLSILMSD